jgi:hypothetical protein
MLAASYEPEWFENNNCAIKKKMPDVIITPGIFNVFSTINDPARSYQLIAHSCPTATLCTASLISLISDTSFSIAFPTTITSAPALQLR